MTNMVFLASIAHICFFVYNSSEMVNTLSSTVTGLTVLDDSLFLAYRSPLRLSGCFSVNAKVGM